MLKGFGVKNKIINSEVKELSDQDEFMCFVAMVETLNNRLQEEKVEIKDIGLVIIDEAHYNSFRKLFKYFKKSTILGVTRNTTEFEHQIADERQLSETHCRRINSSAN